MLVPILTFLLLLTNPVPEPETEVRPLEFSVTHHGDVGDVVSGRLYIMLTKGKVPLIGGPNWFNPEPFYSVEVEDWEKDTPLIVSEQAKGLTGPPSELTDGPWKAVAVLRRNLDTSRIAFEGGLYGSGVVFEGNGQNAGTVSLELENAVPTRDWKPHKNLRLIETKSELLSEFHGREIQHGACVIVPDEYDPNREEPYPVTYWIGGYGSDHYGGRYMKMMFTASFYDDQVCRVILNAQCYGGHHVFADSENNGPRMTAFIDEFLPFLEEKYNLGGSAEKRYLAGHSSGGWASLWLLIQNPDLFSCAWSLAPDPIDFRNFQTADLYAEHANVLFDEHGEPRPIARMGGSPVLLAPEFYALDDTLVDGGQMGSFEWAFSPKGDDGRPKKLCDRQSGEVHQEVVEYWKAYDIRTVLEEHWEELSPKLAGKIKIIAGGLDTFYLEQPVIDLGEFFNEKDFDAMVRVIEGGDHGSVFRASVIVEMDEWFAKKLGLTNNQAPQLGPEPESSE
ncbi:MAG: alpha/beta hydrolase [Phycisphaerales bacterium]|jgi:hypothetical protein|nr:alpha/beta hydrolase [Phycisphaerales bacterium]